MSTVRFEQQKIFKKIDLCLLFCFGRILPLCFCVFLLVFFLLFLFVSFPKHKNTKNISVVSLFYLVSLVSKCYFASLASYGSLWENPKRFRFCSVTLKSKTQKYLLFFFGFVKFGAGFSGLSILYWSVVIILYYSSHTSDSNNDDLRQFESGKRLVWTLFVFIFVHMLIHVDVFSLFV